MRIPTGARPPAVVARASRDGRRPPRLTAVVARLTGANVLGAAAGLVTGPLLARALGPSGRGDLAAILVPLGLAPYILSLGIPAYAQRELPRGRPVGEVIGSLGVPLFALGLLGAAAAVPVADALADGRATVRLFLIISFAALPLLLPGAVLYSSLGGLQRWRGFVATRLTPLLVPLIADVVLYASDRLTVATAAAATIAGAVLAIVPGLSLLTGHGRPVFRARVAREGVAFGLKTWLGNLALLVNVRVDQLLMITAVPPRQLGLYAVAVSLAGASTLLTTAVTPPLMTRVSAGEPRLLPRALRITLAASVALNLVLAAASPILLSFLFGPEFRDAVAMTAVLLAAAVPLAATGILAAGLQAHGSPLIPSIGEGLAITVTVAGLAAALGPWGAVGAAFVSLASYSTSFLFQLVMAQRRIGGPIMSYILPTVADVRWARSLR